jgi:hypothetical protein
MMTEQTLPIDSIVELKGDVADIYARAYPGSKAIVRKGRIDEDGFSLVYVEWDKDDWRYNGQTDGWTYTNHFKYLEMAPKKKKSTKAKATKPKTTAPTEASEVVEVVEVVEVAESVPTPPFSPDNIIKRTKDSLVQRFSPDLTAANDTNEINDSDDAISQEAYAQEIANAYEDLKQGEGFFVIAIKREADPDDSDGVIYTPIIYEGGLTEAATALIRMQLMECTSGISQALLLEMYDNFTGTTTQDPDDFDDEEPHGYGM